MKVSDLQTEITADTIRQLTAAGTLPFVEFENAISRPYFSDRSRRIEDSITADSVTLL